MTTVPSTAEITASRTEWNKWLEDLGDVNRDVRTRDQYGGETETNQLIHHDLPISLTSPVLPGMEQVVAGQIAQVTDAVIAFPHGTDVLISDRITVTSQSDRVFEVLYLAAPSTYQLGAQAYCRERR